MVNSINAQLAPAQVQQKITMGEISGEKSKTHLPPKTTKASIFYVNDVHSNLINLEKLKSASDAFDSFTPSEKTDKLKFSAGDISVGREENFSKLGIAFENATHIMASAAGNHEFDLYKEDLVDALRGNNYKLLGVNLKVPDTFRENKEIRKEVTNSYVQEVNGTKYGVIGVMPFDFMFHLSDQNEYADFEVLTIEKTIPLIQKEIEKFKEQGINKIVVLSHAGLASDREIAQSVEGIDVIIGGHTHDLIKGIKEGKNLFYSKKTGEPTIITQAGRNGDYFGVLNLEFDENGVITTAQNNVTKTASFEKSLVMKNLIDKIIGKPKVIGAIKSAPKHEHTLSSENPSADFVLDAERSELGVDLVLINSGNFRSSFEPGELTDRDLKTLTPFDNKVWVVKLTEKEIVDALKIGAKSLTEEDNMPGIVQCSGLKYTMSKSGELKNVTYLDKDGSEKQIDVNNPNPFKIYTVATDDYVAKGGNGYFTAKEDSIVTKYNFDKNKLVEDYLKKLNAPVDIKLDNRITIID